MTDQPTVEFEWEASEPLVTRYDLRVGEYAASIVYESHGEADGLPWWWEVDGPGAGIFDVECEDYVETVEQAKTCAENAIRELAAACEEFPEMVMEYSDDNDEPGNY